MRLVGVLFVLVVSVATAAPPKTPKDLVGCPFTSDELHAATGMRMK
ncbi:MAG: hypothetical protein AB1730_02075 [Myxococcota bacterium]